MKLGTLIKYNKKSRETRVSLGFGIATKCKKIKRNEYIVKVLWQSGIILSHKSSKLEIIQENYHEK